MKKFVLFLVVLFSTGMVFAQMNYSDIQKVIQRSQVYNPEIINPDLIYPGQVLVYSFEDGYSELHEVLENETQSEIVYQINKLKEAHGELIEPDSVLVEPAPVVIEPMPVVEPAEKSGLAWWLWLLIVISLAGLIWGIIDYFKYNRDPITAGPAQVPNGVTDVDAHRRMLEVAQNRFPGANLDIKNIRRGKLSGPAIVHYSKGKPKRIILKDVQAYAGEVMVNGEIQTIYFLQGCGNDARIGNFMLGSGIVFTPDVIIEEDGSESPIPEVSKEETPRLLGTEDEKVEKAKISPVSNKSSENVGSELKQVAFDQKTLAAEFLKDKTAHRVTMEYEAPAGGKTRIVLETKNEPKS